MRLNKYLSKCGLGSRRKCDQLIREGRVRVNHTIVTELSTLVTERDEVRCDGRMVNPEKTVYILLRKPTGIVTTLHDPQGRRHVGHLIEGLPLVKPVGRLDMNSSGVLLLTNDGDLHYRLTHPRFQVSKEYVALLDRPLDLQDIRKINAGVELDDGAVAHARVLQYTQKRIELELREGMYREVRRLFETLGYRVMELDRIRFAGLAYAGLKAGDWRHLNPAEVLKLKQLCGLA